MKRPAVKPGALGISESKRVTSYLTRGLNTTPTRPHGKAVYGFCGVMTPAVMRTFFWVPISKMVLLLAT